MTGYNYVLDTNALLSASIKGSAPNQVLRHIIKSYTPVHSKETLDEFFDVAMRPENIKRFGKKNIEDIFSMIANSSLQIESTHRITPLAADLKDTMFIELALSANAEGIISGDRHLLSLKYVNFKHAKPIQVWRPADFLRFEMANGRLAAPSNSLKPVV